MALAPMLTLRMVRLMEKILLLNTTNLKRSVKVLLLLASGLLGLKEEATEADSSDSPFERYVENSYYDYEEE